MPTTKPSSPTPEEFILQSDNFANGSTMPIKHACNSLRGNNKSPHLRWSFPPDSTKSFTIIMDDVLQNGTTFIHWQLYNIPTKISEIAEAINSSELTDVIFGANYNGSNFYLGPCPPFGDEAHTYNFTIYAMNTIIEEIDTSIRLNRAQFVNIYLDMIIESYTLRGKFKP